MEVDESTQDTLTKDKVALTKRILEEFKILDKDRFLHKRGSQRKMPLWLFMIVLLKSDEKNICVSWTRKDDYVFKVTNTKCLAEVWGMLRLNSSMNYAKLTRALRYYYGKQLIEKVAEKPYTYCFILSEKTKGFLPRSKSQSPVHSENAAGFQRPNGLLKSNAYHQRPRSLPDCFNRLEDIQTKQAGIKRKQVGGSFFSSLFKNSKTHNPEVHGRDRVRASSLPPSIHWLDASHSQMDPNLGGAENVDLFSDITTLPADDWEDEFLWKKPAKQLETPITSCFTANDLPLLNFEDLRYLDEDVSSETSTSCSYASPRSSEPSVEFDFNFKSGRWTPDMPEVRGVDADVVEKSISNKLSKLTTGYQQFNGQPELNPICSMVDMDVEMDLVQEYIIQHSSN